MCLCFFILLFSPLILLVLSLSPLIFLHPSSLHSTTPRSNPPRPCVISSPSQSLWPFALTSTRFSRISHWSVPCVWLRGLSSGRIMVVMGNSRWAGILHSVRREGVLPSHHIMSLQLLGLRPHLNSRFFSLTVRDIPHVNRPCLTLTPRHGYCLCQPHARCTMSTLVDSSKKVTDRGRRGKLGVRAVMCAYVASRRAMRVGGDDRDA
ncbi:hypothetical protein K439DRAFT_485891 [Ramaria rubella]|nr:hypothetical protein K439DRAFT_485891 [Ramaria rubella]